MTIKNKQLRRLLEENGLDFLQLERGEGYFYVWSDEPVAKEILSYLPSTTILQCYFNQLSVFEWYAEMVYIWARAMGEAH